MDKYDENIMQIVIEVAHASRQQQRKKKTPMALFTRWEIHTTAAYWLEYMWPIQKHVMPHTCAFACALDIQLKSAKRPDYFNGWKYNTQKGIQQIHIHTRTRTKWKASNMESEGFSTFAFWGKLFRHCFYQLITYSFVIVSSIFRSEIKMGKPTNELEWKSNTGF